MNLYSRARYQLNPKKHNKLTRTRNYLVKYGLTAEAYDRLVHAQSGACAICSASGKKLVVDHDHRTGLVRGLLCHSCNMGIGQLGDNYLMVNRAAQYLRMTEDGLAI